MNAKKSKAKTALLLLLGVVLFASGCKPFLCIRRNRPVVVAPALPDPTPSNAFVSQLYSRLRPHRVVIVTPSNRMHEFHEQDEFALALVAGLRKHGVFEAVAGAEVPCNLNAIQSGNFDEQQLVNLANQYNVDAVIYCDVSQFSAYDPLQASVALSIVDARESVVLFCSDGVWNTREPETRSGFEMFLYQNGDDYSVETRLDSPSEFMSYVADSTARFIGQY